MDLCGGSFVAAEVGGVDVEAGDPARCAEADDSPVDAGGVVAASFPAVEEGAVRAELALERAGGRGGEKVDGGSEEVVGDGDDGGAERCAGEL